MPTRQKIAAIACCLLMALCTMPFGARPVHALDHTDDSQIPIIYTLEDLLVWLDATNLPTEYESNPWPCGCEYWCSDGCTCGEDCDCDDNYCDCKPTSEPEPWPCGCEYWCSDGCTCGENCDCDDNYCDCKPTPESDPWPCGCEYWCSDGCMCGEGCDCDEGACDCQYAYVPEPWPCDCEYWCIEDGCTCGEDCDCDDNYCDCKPTPEPDPWPCGCEYWCIDGCTCGEDCDCDDNYCDCKPTPVPDPWPCGCEYWCLGDCECSADCACDCCNTGEGEDPPPAQSNTARLGADIDVVLHPDDILRMEAMHLLTGEYSLTVSRGLLYLFDGATISGEGVNAPVVSVQGRGSLTLHNSSITANGNEAGAGGTALLLEDGVDFLVSNSAICSHGENAVGIRGLGDLDINTDSGVMMGRILWDSMPFRVQATGAGSVAIDAARNVAMLYGHISGDGAAVRAGGEITLDGCAVSPEVEGATLVKRTFVGSFAESSFFLQLGEDFVKENTGQSYFDIIHENTFLATADNAEAKWMWLRYRLEKTEIDVYTPGSYYIPITALAPCDAFDMLGDPPLRIAVYVMHPDIPYFGDAHLFEEIDEYTIGFELMGADIDKERHTLMVSYDEGESWEQFAWEDVRIAEGRWISIEMVGESFSGLLKITAPEGESNQIRVHATRSGFFYCGPPIGDRIGDSSGNQNPPADPEPQVPAEPQSPSLPQEQSPAFRPGITELPSDPSDPSGPPAPSSEQTGVSDSQTQGEAADNPARLPGAAVTGADLRTLLEVYSDYVPFLCGDVLVMLPAEALAALSIGEANVFAVRVEYLPGESLRILLTINNREITDWSQPFFASIPWDGAAPTLFDAAGNLLHCEFDAELGILRITFTSPGLVKLPEQEVAQMPEPLASFTESVLRPADNFAKTEAGGFPALYGILGVVGAGGVGGSVLWRRKWRRK